MLASLPTRAQVAEILNDIGYGLGVLSGASFFGNVHPEAAEYLGLGAVLALGLANRVNPTLPVPAPVSP